MHQDSLNAKYMDPKADPARDIPRFDGVGEAQAEQSTMTIFSSAGPPPLRVCWSVALDCQNRQHAACQPKDYGTIRCRSARCFLPCRGVALPWVRLFSARDGERGQRLLLGRIGGEVFLQAGDTEQLQGEAIQPTER